MANTIACFFHIVNYEYDNDWSPWIYTSFTNLGKLLAHIIVENGLRIRSLHPHKSQPQSHFYFFIKKNENSTLLQKTFPFITCETSMQ